jgi:NitT/TauT family transport system substrate-binding protein
MYCVTRSVALGFVAALSVLLISVSGQAADKVTIISTGKGSPLEWPLFIGMQKGFFAAGSIDIDLVSAASTAAAMQQITGGSGDMGVGGLTDPIRAIDHGANLSVLLLETSKPPYSLWGKSALKSIADLRGKLVIVGGAKDITRIYFERMAQPNGLKTGDYDLTYAGTTPARYAALLSGAVDGAILYPPASFKATAAGFAKLGELGDYVKDLPFTGYAVNVAWAKAHPAMVTGFAKAMNESVGWFYAPANREAAVDILVKESNSDRDDIEKTYDYFTGLHIYPESNAITADTLAGLVKVLASTGDLEGAADPARFIDKDVAALASAAK